MCQPPERSGAGNEILVVLVFALKLQEVVVPAFLAVRKFPADIWPRFINGAATKLVVEKLAG